MFLLGARKAGIVVLTVISPLAVLAYMLPNTKKFYDRWWNLFLGFLIVYPVASLMMGAGDFVSRILLSSSSGFVTWVTAILVGITPIFFIPKIIKSSFNGMGKLGAKVAGFGKTLGGATSTFVRNRDVTKNVMAAADERSNMFKAGIGRNGQAKDLSRIGMLMRGGRRSVVASRKKYDANEANKIRSNLWMNPQYLENRSEYRKVAEANEREKIYIDTFSRNDRSGSPAGGAGVGLGAVRTSNQVIFREALKGKDAAKATAALSVLI
jgi:hypothetical protein